MPSVQSNLLDGLRRLRDERGWTSAKLADELGVTPLTINRWERPESRKAVGDSHERLKGRPPGIPRHVGLALSYLLLREGLAGHGRHNVKVALPQALGSLLPLLARGRAGRVESQQPLGYGNDRTHWERPRLDHAFNLNFDVSHVETGTDALSAIAAGRAHVAGAAAGLIAPFRSSVVEVGVLLRSSSAFSVLACGRDEQKIGTQESQFFGKTLLFPEGSDLGNILVRKLTTLNSSIKTRGVSAKEAQEELTRAAKSQQRKPTDDPPVTYIAWEPLISQLKASLDSEAPLPPGWQWISRVPAARFKEFDLSYEFHLLCSKSWVLDNPAAALSLMLCLAQAELEFAKQPIAAIQDVWREYGLTDRDDIRCRHDLETHHIGYEPSPEVLQLIGPQRLALLDRRDLIGDRA